jgi:hypothetical protein
MLDDRRLYDHNPRAMLELFEGLRTLGPLPAGTSIAC